MVDYNDDSSLFWNRLAVVATIVWVGLAWSTTAWAESGSVRYSYEQVEIGDENQWVLIPEAAPKLRGDVNASAIQGAFNLLKNDKEGSYGDTSISVEGSVPEDAKVVVEIDPEYKQYELIIMAETVYTLSEMGIKDIRFPGHADGNVQRKDIPFSVYTLTVPLWRALPPAGLVDARVRMPDGALMDINDVYERWNRGDQKLRDALYSYLDDDISYTVVSVLKRLPKLEVDYASEVVPLLERDTRAVRGAALKALAEHRDDQEVLEAVVTMMNEDENAKLARRAAEFLGKAESDRYRVQKQFYLLEDGSDEEKLAAAKELKNYEGDDRVVERLGTALEADTSKLASKAASSLVELQAYEALGEVLGREAIASEIRIEIAEALAEQNDDGARIDGLRYLASHKKGRLAREALRKLADVGTDAARKTAESFLTADDRQLRLAAVETVKQFDSLESLGAIAEAVRTLENTEAVEEAGYEILVGQPESTVIDKTDSSDTIIRRIAYRALGGKAGDGGASAEVVDRLKTGTESSDALIRGAAARGLGEVGGNEALEALSKLTDDRSARVRRDVAYALGNYRDGEKADLLADYLSDDSPAVRAAAIDSLERRGEAHALDTIESLTEADDSRVRKEAYEALAGLVPDDNEEQVRNVISTLSGAVTSEDDPMVLRGVLRALGQFKKERAVNSIAIQLNAKEREMRLVALEALQNSGHDHAVELVIDTLGDPDVEVRRAAIEALSNMDATKARPALVERLQDEENKELQKLIEQKLETL